MVRVTVLLCTPLLAHLVVLDLIVLTDILERIKAAYGSLHITTEGFEVDATKAIRQ